GLWSKIKEAAKTAGLMAMGFVNDMV
uniref:Dermaseptin-DI5 n=1 Tax=Phyllomedusa distincta TaxID=164618 RepID=DRS5_PHYDS|nr:RecName: Full=Dermaseptin-DI5; Short=DRS-DI5; AltName: Full=Dermadistinctin-Q2; Short=DD Q2 [Phyllomedusa distincta]